MAYGNYKDLARKIASDKILRDKEVSVAKNPKYDGYQRGLASMVYRFFYKIISGSGVNGETKQNQQELAEELRKPN